MVLLGLLASEATFYEPKNCFKEGDAEAVLKKCLDSIQTTSVETVGIDAMESG